MSWLYLVLVALTAILVLILLPTGLLFGLRAHKTNHAATARLATITHLATAGLVSTQPPPDGLLLGRYAQSWVSVQPTPARQEIGHCLVVGPPRSGKSLLAVTQLLSWSHSAIVSDPRGELHNLTAGWRSKIGNVQVLDLVTGAGARYNPLALADPRTFAESLLDSPGDEHSGGQVYTQRAVQLLTALWSVARTEGVPGMVFAARMLAAGLDGCIDRMRLSDASLARATFSDSPRSDRLLQGAWSGLYSRLAPLLSDAALRTFSGNDIEPSDFDQALPLTVYVLTGEQPSPVLLRATVGQLLNDVLSHRNCSARDTSLIRLDSGPVAMQPLLAILDEAGTVALPALDTLAATAASRRVSLWLGLQSVSQLEANYGRAKANSILGSVHHSVYFRPTDFPSADALSKRIGQTLVLRNGGSVSRTGMTSTAMVTQSAYETAWPLIPPSDLLTLPDDVSVVLSRGLPPAVLRRCDWRTDLSLNHLAGLPVPTVQPLADTPSLLLPGTIELGEPATREHTNGRAVPLDQWQERIEARLLRSGECRLWLGSCNSRGYPKVSWNGKSQLVHRLVFERAHGPIPDKQTIDHRMPPDGPCTSIRCCEISHLRLLKRGPNTHASWDRARKLGG